MGSIGAHRNTATSLLSDARALGNYIREQRDEKQNEEGLDWRRKWKSTKMYTYNIDGKEITTNYGAGTYPYWNGNGGGTYTRVGLRQSTEEVLIRLINEGYNTFQIKQLASGQIRGYSELYIFYSRDKRRK